jgi:hypothetical protein
MFDHHLARVDAEWDRTFTADEIPLEQLSRENGERYFSMGLNDVTATWRRREEGLQACKQRAVILDLHYGMRELEIRCLC